MVKIALTGGGTGGHIYPGIAVTEALKGRIQAEFFWIGSQTGMDRSIVEGAGIPFRGIPAGKLRRYVSPRNLVDFFKVLAGFLKARSILKKERPCLLFSKGGFVSVPPCAAARSLGIPVYTHESDLSPGLATRINARFARRIFTAYKETGRFFSRAYQDKIITSGNPVRREFFYADRERGRRFLGLEGPGPVLLVLGGSQGAREINERIRTWLPELVGVFTVVHQTGKDWEAPPPGARYKPYAYINREMPCALAASDLVLGRSGAGTLWECAVLGKPMALIPLRGRGTRGDQVENAELFKKAGAALVLEAEDLEGEGRRALDLVLELGGNSEKRNAMASASHAMGSSDAAAFLAGVLIESEELV
jgi:UDP-N-acetylglucosamine--N-acetylmuramyl-(pentapeptide) pyrophosphoryl-undecaprenol N-acetylglucosamine transferase